MPSGPIIGPPIMLPCCIPIGPFGPIIGPLGPIIWSSITLRRSPHHTPTRSHARAPIHWVVHRRALLLVLHTAACLPLLLLRRTRWGAPSPSHWISEVSRHHSLN